MILVNSLSEAALGWRHQAFQTWSAVMWRIARAAEQRAHTLDRQTCCSWSRESDDSTLSYFPFRATQLRCDESERANNTFMEEFLLLYACTFSFPPFQTWKKLPLALLSDFASSWLFVVARKTFKTLMIDYWNIQVLALMFHLHKV